MGTFDPSSFLDVNIQEANSTESTPCPEGEYTAVSQEPVVRQWTSQDGTKSGVAIDLNWEVDATSYPSIKEATGRDKVFVKQGIMLDLNSNGGIETGKGANVALGRLRQALGLNKPGESFSFRQLGGRVAKISVKHRIQGDATYADVKGVAPA